MTIKNNDGGKLCGISDIKMRPASCVPGVEVVKGLSSKEDAEVSLLK